MRKELAVWRSPNGGSRSVPIGSRSRRESPTGYSSAGCSPAEPASARHPALALMGNRLVPSCQSDVISTLHAG